MISGDPLAGRDDELASIRRALSGGSKSSGVVIVGAAGVGKTRLAREVLARAEAGGERTNWIVGTESARALPLGRFAPIGTTDSEHAFCALLEMLRKTFPRYPARPQRRSPTHRLKSRATRRSTVC